MEYQLPVDYRKLHWKERKIVREQYINLQKGLCSHCGSPLSGEPAPKMFNYWIKKALFPKGFFEYPVHLHHDHKTGMTIGAVHNVCNAVLWQYFGE